MISPCLRNALTTPTRAAHLLERSRGRRPLLTIEIQRHRISHSIVWNIVGDEEDVELLPDVSVDSVDGSKRICFEALESISETVYDHNISAAVVNWPLQADTGKMGGPCGRVLFTLEALMRKYSSSKNSLFSAHRPLCLWTPRSTIVSLPPPEDGWGRSARYGRAPIVDPSTVYSAVKEQYSFDESLDASDLWKDFWRSHWPDLYQRHLVKASRKAAPRRYQLSTNNLVADWRDSSSASDMPREMAL